MCLSVCVCVCMCVRTLARACVSLSAHTHAAASLCCSTLYDPLYDSLFDSRCRYDSAVMFLDTMHAWAHYKVGGFACVFFCECVCVCVCVRVRVRVRVCLCTEKCATCSADAFPPPSLPSVVAAAGSGGRAGGQAAAFKGFLNVRVCVCASCVCFSARAQF